MEPFFVLFIPDISAKPDAMYDSPKNPVPIHAMPYSNHCENDQSIDIDIMTLHAPAIVKKIFPEHRGCGHVPVGPEL